MYKFSGDSHLEKDFQLLWKHVGLAGLPEKSGLQ